MQFIVDWLYFQYLSQVKLNKLIAQTKLSFIRFYFLKPKKKNSLYCTAESNNNPRFYDLLTFL